MECLFLRSRDPERVASLLTAYTPDAAAGTTAVEGWPSTPSYPATLRVSPLRRTLAESADFPRYWPSILSDGGRRLELAWLQLVEERDTVDLALAAFLSHRLATSALAVHASEGTDVYGFCSFRDGAREASFYREMEERPLYRIDQELEGRGIPYCVCRYRDCGGPGWREVRVGA